MRFSREYKLVNKEDFQFVFAKPTKITQSYLMAFFRANSLRNARLGIIVTKRQVPRAVDRILLKRLIREGFRAILPKLVSIDIIIMVRGKPSSLDKHILRADIDRLLNSVSNSQKRVL